jgi:hypothetical protein
VLWSVMGNAMFPEEMRITRGNDGIAGEKPSMTVIGMKAVTLPWVMTKNDLGSESTYVAGNFATEFAGVIEISVDLVHENDLTLGSQSSRRFALLNLSLSDESRDVGIRIPCSFRPISEY